MKKSEAFVLASIRALIPDMSGMNRACFTMHSELYNALRECGIQPKGPEISMYHNKEYRETDIDVEVGIVVDNHYAGAKGLPPLLNITPIGEEKKVASLIYRGPYSNTKSGILALLNWIGLNNWNIKGILREIHISGPAHQNGIVQAEPVSELQIPIEG